MNIHYSGMNNKGYWISLSPETLFLETTRTCPGTYFIGIKSNCDLENIKITKKKESPSSQKVVYDGNIITLCHPTTYCDQVFDIYSEGSETLKSDLEYPPSRTSWKHYLEEVSTNST